MNIDIAGVKITFGTVSELHDALKRKIGDLDKAIQDHETKALNLRRARKEMLKTLGEQPDSAKCAAEGAARA
jgi:hypothetical protein